MSERNHSHHSRHHSKHHKHHRGIRHWLRHNKKLAIVGSCMVILLLIGMVIFTVQNQKKQKTMHITSGNAVDMGAGYREINYKGKTYRYNTLVTSVLYAGIDSDGEMQAYEQYSVAPRADSIYLIVLNQKTQKMSIVGISRDTMTQVRRYTISGYDRGTYETHLGFAYTYGNGGEASCENLREAVSTLFQNIPITEYAVTNRSSMSVINQIVGGVEVTVPNDELAGEHPLWTKGAVITLADDEVETYLRRRDTSVDFTNVGRMERQKSYIIPYVEKMKAQIEKDTNKIWKKVEQSQGYIQTSITKNKYLSMANLLSKMEFSDSDFYEIEGENIVGTEHDEFYVNQEALMDLVIELFYEER